MRDGAVVEVGVGLEAAEVLDATGAIVTPGFVDLHTHLREPGDEDAETIETGKPFPVTTDEMLNVAGAFEAIIRSMSEITSFEYV